MNKFEANKTYSNGSSTFTVLSRTEKTLIAEGGSKMKIHNGENGEFVKILGKKHNNVVEAK